MMDERILVYDVAAEDGGGLAILNEYYQKAQKSSKQYIFVDSGDHLQKTGNISVVSLPWVKKSWIHRLYCDFVYVRKIIKKSKCNKVLSLQNIAIFGCGIPQIVYVQNCIPFSTYRFSLKKDPKFWIYQNMIGGLCKLSLRHAQRFVVQSEWMKQALQDQCGIDAKRIRVVGTRAEDYKGVVESNNYTGDVCRFFYPAYGYPYKNHQIILDSVKQIMSTEKSKEFEVIFTLEKDTNRYTQGIYREVLDYHLPIRFVGSLDKGSMLELYKKSILIFPSHLETVGLPIKEAMLLDINIIAADLSYAHEAASGYEKIQFFSPDKPGELKELMMNMM